MVTLEQDLVLTAPPGGSGTFGRIDLNGDGIDNVTLLVGSATSSNSAGYNGVVNLFGQGGAQLAYTPGSYPTAFQAGEFIGSSLYFQGGVQTLAFSSGGWRNGRGNWYGGADAYFGVLFQIGELFHYGWVHAVWDPDLNTLSVDRTGYEDTGDRAEVLPPTPDYPPDFQHHFGDKTDAENGIIEVIWPVLAGKTYNLQRSFDLDEWSTIYSKTATADGEIIYLDNEFESAPKEKCFYRVGQQLGSPLLLLALGLRRKTLTPKEGE